MLGCLGRTVLVVVALVLIALGAAAWFSRDLWLGSAPPPAAASETSEWAPVPDDGGATVRRQLAALGAKGGAVFVNVTAPELLAYALGSLRAMLPAGASALRARVAGDLVYVKGVVALADLGGSQVLGPLAAVLPARDTVEIGGALDILRANGGGQLHVRAIRVGNLQLPPALIPAVLRRLRRGPMPAGLADDALPVPLPAAVADVRVRGGRITLYRNTP
ncbi:MAG: hypothetical protein HYX65_09110 [Gemmatimonadetes bacterium]|nr:hypothetical protein [Gemmatimonadota bacterium]